MGGPPTGFPGFQSGSGRIDSGQYGAETRITMNLEDVVLHEQKLSTILENLRNDTNASLACEDWWDLTESSDLYTTVFSKLIKDIQLRQLMV